jgi:hypothetical protein
MTADLRDQIAVSLRLAFPGAPRENVEAIADAVMPVVAAARKHLADRLAACNRDLVHTAGARAELAERLDAAEARITAALAVLEPGNDCSYGYGDGEPGCACDKCRVRAALRGVNPYGAAPSPAAHAYVPPPAGWAIANFWPPPCSAEVDSAVLPGLRDACRRPESDPIHIAAETLADHAFEASNLADRCGFHVVYSDGIGEFCTRRSADARHTMAAVRTGAGSAAPAPTPPAAYEWNWAPIHTFDPWPKRPDLCKFWIGPHTDDGNHCWGRADDPKHAAGPATPEPDTAPTSFVQRHRDGSACTAGGLCSDEHPAAGVGHLGVDDDDCDRKGCVCSVDDGPDVEHLRLPDGRCVISLAGQGHLPCNAHPAAGGGTNVDTAAIREIVCQWRDMVLGGGTAVNAQYARRSVLALADALDAAEAHVAALTADLAQWKARGWATTYELTAWKHDIGEHKDSEHPYAYCPRCEIEHPAGRLAQVKAELAAAKATIEWIHDGASGARLCGDCKINLRAALTPQAPTAGGAS